MHFLCLLTAVRCLWSAFLLHRCEQNCEQMKKDIKNPEFSFFAYHAAYRVHKMYLKLKHINLFKVPGKWWLSKLKAKLTMTGICDKLYKSVPYIIATKMLHINCSNPHYLHHPSGYRSTTQIHKKIQVYKNDWLYNLIGTIYSIVWLIIQSSAKLCTLFTIIGHSGRSTLYHHMHE